MKRRSSKSKMTITHSQLSHRRGGKQSRQTDVSATVMKGAAGVALAAGVVAAGAALANKDARHKLGQAASKGMEFMQDTAAGLQDQAEEAYPAVQHQISRVKNKVTGSSSKKRSRRSS